MNSILLILLGLALVYYFIMTGGVSTPNLSVINNKTITTDISRVEGAGGIKQEIEYTQIHNETPIKLNMGYPSGILPGKVGTFHPTNGCDSHISQGCMSCGNIKQSNITDDNCRNYPQLIDTIRAKRSNEYPVYKM